MQGRQPSPQADRRHDHARVPQAGEIRLCVFDCDGTLVDSQHSIVSCMSDAFQAHGLPAPEAGAVRRVVGLSLADAIGVLTAEEDGQLVERLASAYSASFAEVRQRGAVVDPLFPGAREGLGELEAAGWLLGLATGKSQRGARATLAGHGLEERFVTIKTPDVAAGKPNPDMLLQAMADTGADPRSTVMVGDTVYDMEMALSAGSLAVAVAWGYHDAEELRAAGAHAVIDAFGDLLPTVRALHDHA